MGERNGSWIVSSVKWKMKPEGLPNVGSCGSKYFRREEDARDYYNLILRQCEEELGFVFSPLQKSWDFREYEGVQGVSFSEKYGDVYMCLFIDRNRTY